MSEHPPPRGPRLAFIRWIWNHTMTCKEVARLASQQLEAPLPRLPRLRIRLHTLICVWCARYLRQVAQIRAAAPGYAEKVGETSAKSLSPDARELLKRALKSGGGNAPPRA